MHFALQAFDHDLVATTFLVVEALLEPFNHIVV